MSDDLSKLAEIILAAAQKAGASEADVLISRGTSIAIDVRAGELEQAERSEGLELGLRALVGHRQACMSVSDTSGDALQSMAERAVLMARESPEDPSLGLASEEQLSLVRDAEALELYDEAPEPTPSALEDNAKAAEAAALAVKGVTQVQSVSAGYGFQEIVLAASNGFSGTFKRSETGLSAQAISGEGLEMERDYAAEDRVFAADLPSPEEIGTKAGKRAAERAGSRKPPTGAFPVLFDERVSSSLIGHLLSAVNGSAITRGASWARDLMGQDVLPSELSIIENPLRPRTPGSRLFDAEGLPTRARTIVDKGVLTGWTLDLGTGRKLDLPSTANAVRGPGSPPSPGISNIALTQSAKTREMLLNEMGTGLLVTSLIGSTINQNTGDYSRGASGFWVENGEPTYPVNECTIAGNLRDMLMTIVAANDARQHLSRVVPSLLVEGMSLAGE